MADNLREFDNIVVNSHMSDPKEKYFLRSEFELLTDPIVLLNAEDYEMLCIDYGGTCAWNVGSTLACNLVEDNVGPLVTNLQRESELLALDIEVFSEEPGWGFQEHYLYKQGWEIKNEILPYEDIYNEKTDEYERTGGFESWGFTI